MTDKPISKEMIGLVIADAEIEIEKWFMSIKVEEKSMTIDILLTKFIIFKLHKPWPTKTGN